MKSSLYSISFIGKTKNQRSREVFEVMESFNPEILLRMLEYQRRLSQSSRWVSQGAIDIAFACDGEEIASHPLFPVDLETDCDRDIGVRLFQLADNQLRHPTLRCWNVYHHLDNAGFKRVSVEMNIDRTHRRRIFMPNMPELRSIWMRGSERKELYANEMLFPI